MEQTAIGPGATVDDSIEAFEEIKFSLGQTSARNLSIPEEMWNKHGHEIASFIADEISKAQGERDDYFDQVERWKILYDAPIPKEPKNFPFANASNLHVTLIKETVNIISGQLVQSTMTAEPRWVFTDLAPEFEPVTDELEQFMDVAAIREIGYDQEMLPAIVETAKIGTEILEVGYEIEKKRQYVYSDEGDRVVPVMKTMKDGPALWRVPLQNFFIRFGEPDIQRAKWVAVKKYYTYDELLMKEKQGKFYDVERVKHAEELPRRNDDVIDIEEELDEIDPTEPKMIEVFEVHLRWNIDDNSDGLPQDIIVYWNRSRNVVLGAKFAPFWHGRRPFVKLGFFPKPGRFYDEGIAEMLEQSQYSISAIRNRRADNATMANLKMFITRRGQKGLFPGDKLYPGKIIEVNDIFNDIREFQMSEIYPSTLNEEVVERQYADSLSGINEAVAGSAMPVTRTTATAQLALLQEQARRLDLSIRNIRTAQNEIGRQILSLYQQYGALGKAIAWFGRERGTMIEAFFRLPRQAVDVGMGLKINTPTSTQNRQVKRESAIAMFNLMSQMYNNLIPLVAQLTGPEQVALVVGEMVRGAEKFMGDVLESFETSNPSEILAGLEAIKRILPSAEDLGGLEANERAEALNTVLERISGMEALLLSADGASTRGPGISRVAEGTDSDGPVTGAVSGNLADAFLG